MTSSQVSSSERELALAAVNRAVDWSGRDGEEFLRDLHRHGIILSGPHGKILPRPYCFGCDAEDGLHSVIEISIPGGRLYWLCDDCYSRQPWEVLYPLYAPLSL